MRNKVNIFNKKFVMLAVILLFCALTIMFFIDIKPNKIVNATTEITNTTEIYNDGEILGSKLWKAIKKFYTDNCNEETSGRIHIQEQTEKEYFYPDILKNFNVSNLDLSNNEIDNLKNFGCLDLNTFTTLNLSNNRIKEINSELKQAENLQEINLSNNQIKTFSYENLNLKVYSLALQNLDISNNQISICNLSQISCGSIDAKLNYITKEKLSLPLNLSIQVNLSHNLIDSPNTSNSNIIFGFQGVKNESVYNIGKKIYFNSFEEINQLSIYSLTYNEADEIFVENELVASVNDGDEYLFGLGYYRVKFVEGESDNPMTSPITIFVRPKAPTIKMVIDDVETEELQYSITKPTMLKFYGDDNATFEYYLNNSEAKNSNSVEIKKAGINIIKVYQIIDGYRSEAVQIFITYKEPQSLNWIFTVVGALVFALIFYVAIKNIPRLSKIHIGKSKDNKKDDLD